jgi:DNA-binding NarL/FixJ family response regulator
VTPARVLLVDDEPEVIAGLKAALYKEPYELLSTSDPLEALSIVESQPIDCIVSDERMPAMEGAELVKRVRAVDPAIVRIILTGQGDFESAVSAINDGAVFRYLVKPFQARVLADTIREGLQAKIHNEVRQRVWDGARTQFAAVAGYEAAFADLGVPEESLTRDISPIATRVSVRSGDEWKHLSERERQIVDALLIGEDAKTAARKLAISVHTVRNHLKAIYRKLSVHSQLELVSLFSREPARK